MNIQSQIKALIKTKETLLAQGRNDFAKPLNTALLHGGGVTSMANAIESYDLPSEVVLQLTTKALEEAYGAEWSIPNKIARLGTNIHKQGHSIIEWTMPDKFIAKSVGYTQNTKVEVTSFLNDKNHKATITCQMPIWAVAGQILDAHTSGAKVYGLYANFIHSWDSYLMREFYRQTTFKFTDILDKVKCRPENIEATFEIMHEILEEIQPLYQQTLNYICNKYELPLLDLNTQDLKILNTKNFLAS